MVRGIKNLSKNLFTSEAVTEGHPDKIADQISDAILDAIIGQDPNARVAAETMVTTGLVFVSGEITTDCYIDITKLVRNTIQEIGYTRAKYGFDSETCAVITSLDEQSGDIALGVDNAYEAKKGEMSDQELAAIGAGDQGMMFGYATTETDNYMPLSLDLSHALLLELANIRKNESELMPYLRPDAKSQVTVEYSDDGIPLRIDTIVISTQHDEFEKPRKDTKEAALEADERMRSRIETDIRTILIPRVQAQYKRRKDILKLFEGDIKYFVNPTGKFVIGGPTGDTGLTGRKIIVDTYGGKAAHGGGAFSGKDPSKVDRSAAYAARHIAKNMVAAGVASEIMIQISYAIGVAEPMSIYVNTFGKSKVSLSDSEIASKIGLLFDLRPKAIEQRLKLRNPIYLETASYGHMGREPQIVKKIFNSRYMSKPIEYNVELFTWEKLDYVDKIKKEFNLD